jgi:hypothetical protein
MKLLVTQFSPAMLPPSLLNTLFSNILNMCSSLSVRPSAHSHKTMNNYSYILTFRFIDRRQEDKGF